MIVTAVYSESAKEVLAGPVLTGGYRIALVGKDGQIHHIANSDSKDGCIQGLRDCGFGVQDNL